jgi:uncharacterized protein
MLDRLPETVEPVGLADAGRSFRGEVAVADLVRLGPMLSDRDGSLHVSLVFRRDERRIRVLEGNVDGEIHLVCQRCLKPLLWPLRLQFRLGIVSDEAGIDRLPDGYEPLLVQFEPLKTAEVVEDEILLAVPTVPMHQGAQRCDSGYRNRPVAERDNPFAVLDKLKT